MEQLSITYYDTAIGKIAVDKKDNKYYVLNKFYISDKEQTKIDKAYIKKFKPNFISKKEIDDFLQSLVKNAIDKTKANVSYSEVDKNYPLLHLSIKEGFASIAYVYNNKLVCITTNDSIVIEPAIMQCNNLPEVNKVYCEKFFKYSFYFDTERLTCKDVSNILNNIIKD
jgi:hypothetical protein